MNDKLHKRVNALHRSLLFEAFSEVVHANFRKHIVPAYLYKLFEIAINLINLQKYYFRQLFIGRYVLSKALVFLSDY